MTRELILEYVKSKKSASVYKSNYFKNEILPFINKNIPEIIKDERPKVKLYWFLNNLTDYPTCKAPNCSNKVTKLPNGENSSYGKVCSLKCSGVYTMNSLSNETRSEMKIKTKKTVSNFSKEKKDLIANKKRESWFSKDRTGVSEKRKETCVEKYGVDNPMKVKEIREKSEETRLKKYGVKCFNPQKEKETKLKKYGNETYNNPEKISKTNKKVWGSGTNLRIKQTEKNDYEKIYKKHKSTIFKKYGVENISQIPEVHDKKVKTGYRSKDYVLPSGKTVKIQGYENFLLDELLKEFNEEEIFTDSLDMPVFEYIGEDGKRHRYFPDVYVPKTNTIYEVKSTYTVKQDQEKNKRKFESVKKAGFNFELKVY
jgi:hypothetical protein